MSVHVINNQIQFTQQSIYQANINLQDLLDQQSRIENALQKLRVLQDELKQNNRLVVKPEFTKMTWHGHLATRFEHYRQTSLSDQYCHLYQQQLGQVIVQLKTKLLSLGLNINETRAAINRDRLRLHRLRTEKRRELAKVNERN
ncbi:hypothetical protein [Amphibacillus cookii]|uniref:hypothetical protein n=1 Tax=Amphibacillus cookii TaxID=767787 RepID=UPI00195CA6DC|nr:hypothetical protein [Amphibacillus cookii]MBM7543012.1 hypothetical protein [Amphibacillus cookii]